MGFRKIKESKLIDALQETDKEVESLKDVVNSLKEKIGDIADKLEALDNAADYYISRDTCKTLIHGETRDLKMELSKEIDERFAGLKDRLEQKTEQQVNNIIDEIVKRKIEEIKDQILVSVVRKSMGIERS